MSHPDASKGVLCHGGDSKSPETVRLTETFIVHAVKPEQSLISTQPDKAFIVLKYFVHFHRPVSLQWMVLLKKRRLRYTQRHVERHQYNQQFQDFSHISSCDSVALKATSISVAIFWLTNVGMDMSWSVSGTKKVAS